MVTSEQLALWAREYQRLANRWGYARDLPDCTTPEALLAAITADGEVAVGHIRRHVEATLRGKNDKYWEEEAEYMIGEFRAAAAVLRQNIEEHAG